MQAVPSLHDSEKKNPNFEEKMIFCLKYDMRNLVNFNPRSGESEYLHFDRLLLWRGEYVMFELKKYRGVVL